MSKPFFTAEDFKELGDFDYGASKIANAKLELEGKVVYNTYGKEPGWYKEDSNYATHTALLICVEPIEKPECKHETLSTSSINHNYHSAFCQDCREYLKPTQWEVSK